MKGKSWYASQIVWVVLKYGEERGGTRRNVEWARQAGGASPPKRLCIEPWLYINYLSMVQYDLTYSANYFFMNSCVGFGMGGGRSTGSIWVEASI